MIYIIFFITFVLETWKSPIQNGIYKTIGLNSGGFLMLIVGIALHGVTKQKMLTIAVDIGAVGAGITGGMLFSFPYKDTCIKYAFYIIFYPFLKIYIEDISNL